MSQGVVVGGGLAGLAVSVALAQNGQRVLLLESKNRLGGRAGSFLDAHSGQLVDACQHVSMGCCTNLAHFFRTIGIESLLERQTALHFMTPDGKVSLFRGDRWPAPLHLARAFLGLHYFSWSEKARIGYGLARLRLASADNDAPLLPWLRKHHQTDRTIRRFWEVVLVSALNESIDRMGLRYARKVFVDGFLRHRDGFQVDVPTVPLGRLYGDELQTWLAEHNVELRIGEAVERIDIEEERVSRLILRSGEKLSADWYVLAVPPARLLDVLPRKVVESTPTFGKLRQFQVSPITSVHLWFDRPITDWPHVVLVDCLGQWLFNRGESALGEHYVQIVISASRNLQGQPHAVIQRLVLEELTKLFPQTGQANLLRARVVTEKSATFSVVPGVDAIRPAQQAPIENLYLAGDWTATGWPATMEGAVRSGYLAAEALLRKLGSPSKLLQPDLV